MLALVPATPDRPIDALDKIYTRLMLGDRAMNKQAPQVMAKPTVLKETRQLKRQAERARTKEQRKIDKASGIR